MGVVRGVVMVSREMKLHALFALPLFSLLYVQEAAAEDPGHHQYCVIGAGPGGVR